jgi:hypothetical protein
MADGANDTPTKKKTKKGFGMGAMVINSIVSLVTGALGTLGVLAGTDSIRTEEERAAAKKAKELEAKKTT